MKSIKFALTERFYVWEDAVKVARDDPEINMDGGENEAYNPSAYEDDISTETQATQGSTSAELGANDSAPGADEPAKTGAKLEKQTVQGLGTA